MGTSIAACLLGAGHRLACVESDPTKLRTAPKRLRELLADAWKRELERFLSSYILKSEKRVR
jgi:hypothetical protein